MVKSGLIDAPSPGSIEPAEGAREPTHRDRVAGHAVHRDARQAGLKRPELLSGLLVTRST